MVKNQTNNRTKQSEKIGQFFAIKIYIKEEQLKEIEQILKDKNNPPEQTTRKAIIDRIEYGLNQLCQSFQSQDLKWHFTNTLGLFRHYVPQPELDKKKNKKNNK